MYSGTKLKKFITCCLTSTPRCAFKEVEKALLTPTPLLPAPYRNYLYSLYILGCTKVKPTSTYAVATYAVE